MLTYCRMAVRHFSFCLQLCRGSINSRHFSCNVCFYLLFTRFGKHRPRHSTTPSTHTHTTPPCQAPLLPLSSQPLSSQHKSLSQSGKSNRIVVGTVLSRLNESIADQFAPQAATQSLDSSTLVFTSWSIDPQHGPGLVSFSHLGGLQWP